MTVDTEVGGAKPLGSIETRSFDYVPPSERHGQPNQMFYMWFGINTTIFCLVTGFIRIKLGLSFWWTLLAIIIGNVLGALFMALHAAQGPQLTCLCTASRTAASAQESSAPVPSW